MKITIKGDPRTKKNSAQIVGNGRRIIPSKAFREYARFADLQIPARCRRDIAFPVNVACVYYMKTKRRVDLVNLLEGTCDILTAAHVIEDDHSGIVASHDGSRVAYSKDDPRVEIEITEAD